MKTLKEKCEELNKVRSQLREFGATDSEPNWNFERLLRAKLVRGENPEVKNEDWQLYSIPGSSAAAQRLTNRMKTLLKSIDKTPHAQVQEVIQYYGLNQ